jgi:hypothetical protein
LTRDSKARKGRDFANYVAQAMQRAHLDAMSLRVPTFTLICGSSVVTYRNDQNTPLRSLSAPTGVAIWDANITNTVPSSAVLPTSQGAGCVWLYFNSMGNAGTTISSANLASWTVYVRNTNLPPTHPDGGFVIGVTGLTSFVSTRNFTFSH